jgi:hypothetical protein
VGNRRVRVGMAHHGLIGEQDRQGIHQCPGSQERFCGRVSCVLEAARQGLVHGVRRRRLPNPSIPVHWRRVLSPRPGCRPEGESCSRDLTEEGGPGYDRVTRVERGSRNLL